jgi:hypothetical protein
MERDQDGNTHHDGVANFNSYHDTDGDLLADIYCHINAFIYTNAHYDRHCHIHGRAIVILHRYSGINSNIHFNNDRDCFKYGHGHEYGKSSFDSHPNRDHTGFNGHAFIYGDIYPFDDGIRNCNTDGHGYGKINRDADRDNDRYFHKYSIYKPDKYTDYHAYMHGNSADRNIHADMHCNFYRYVYFYADAVQYAYGR